MSEPPNHCAHVEAYYTVLLLEAQDCVRIFMAGGRRQAFYFERWCFLRGMARVYNYLADCT